jgi:hypothetical protein
MVRKYPLTPFRFFSLSIPDRIKAVSIENRWFSAVVQQMYHKFKYDDKIRFQLKMEDVSSEDYCIQTLMNNGQPQYTDTMSLDNFFNIRSTNYQLDDSVINQNLFLKELKYYSLREQNDTITLSTHLLENEDIFKFHLDYFSNGRAFQNYCT